MKKLMALVLAVVCVVSLFGCAAAGHENEIQTPNAPQEDLLANNRNTSSETTENPDASANVICSRIQLSYHANKDTAIMIEDTIVCSELMGYISKAAGTRGESTKGYYGAPYKLTIYVEGKEEPLGFTVWDCGQYSTSEYKDDEGYEFFFNDDISDLYKYLEEKYPDEFWYPDMIDKAFDITVSYANYASWEELKEIYDKALNRDIFTQSAVKHLPLWKMDTYEELNQFKDDIDGILSVDQGYDILPSFNAATEQYDESFFRENTLLLVYITASSGSYRFSVDSIEQAYGCICIHVKRGKAPGFFTDDMAGWFITVAIPDATAEAFSEFDADEDNIPKQNEIPGATVHVVDIWDKTTKEQILCASALEKFWEDETNEYYFECIKSDYVMVMDSTGRIIDVVTALEEGLITVEDLDTYCIGYAAKPKVPDKTTREIANHQELPLTIISNETNVTPYFHLANSKEWDGEYFLVGDGVDLSAVLEELEVSGCIPRVEYSQDFGVVLGDGVTITHILLFDETFNQLDIVWDIAELVKLDAGNYYVGIVVNQDGDYITEAKEKESFGWACVVRLTIYEHIDTCTRIKLSYHANKDTAIMIEDSVVCSELLGYIAKAAGAQGESTKGYYGAPYALTIYFAGEKEPLSFTVWDNRQYSTSKHKDNEGYAFFFNDDISDLYQYLEENYPDEFWYVDATEDR